MRSFILAINMPTTAIITIPLPVGLDRTACVAVARDETIITEIVNHVSVRFIIGLIKINQTVTRKTDEPKYRPIV